MEREFCQSCAMPLGDPGMYGTNADESRNEDYCVYCYAMGGFTEELTMEEMMEQCADMMETQTQGMPDIPPREEYLERMKEYFPTLKRWQK